MNMVWDRYRRLRMVHVRYRIAGNGNLLRLHPKSISQQPKTTMSAAAVPFLISAMDCLLE